MELNSKTNSHLALDERKKLNQEIQVESEFRREESEISQSQTLLDTDVLSNASLKDTNQEESLSEKINFAKEREECSDSIESDNIGSLKAGDQISLTSDMSNINQLLGSDTNSKAESSDQVTNGEDSETNSDVKEVQQRHVLELTDSEKKGPSKLIY